MSKRKSTLLFLTNTQIQRQQLQLTKIERELEKILGTVNEAINELKVEELQLKAGMAGALSENYDTFDDYYKQEQPTTSSSIHLLPAQTQQDIADDDINKQFIDLNTLKMKHSVEEEDDEF